MGAYPLFPSRKTLSLDGAWDFKWLGDKTPLEKLDPSKLSYDSFMAVPGAFDGPPELAGRRGVGVYRTQVRVSSGKELRLKIGGMGLRGRVFWDGREIGSTDLAYSGVSFDFKAGQGDRHELAIAADNGIPEDKAILFKGLYDFYGYGGLYRGVELQELPSLRIERVQVSTASLAKRSVNLKLLVAGRLSGELRFEVSFDGAKPKAFSRKIKDGAVALELPVPGGKLWSPESPNLHTVEVSVDGDSVIERFGIRTVEAKDGRILLNGKPVELRGVNRHEAHPELGPALPVSLMVEDVQFLKDLGCNFVRGAHYPQSQQFLDLCDQAGVLVWEESLGWGDGEERVTDPRFCELQEAQTRQMVRNSFNHPSVIIWAFLNEGCSQLETARPLYSRLVKAIREEDSSRLVSYASCRSVHDALLDLVDLVSMNIYPAWIDGNDWGRPEPFERISAFVDKLAKFCSKPELKGKPLILSEIGACGLLGCRDRLRAGWSEEFQSDYFSEAIRSVFANKRYSGITLWQMYDTRTFAAHGDVRSKARAFNNAGVLDEYRRPKLAYDAVKAAFKTLAAKDVKANTRKRGL